MISNEKQAAKFYKRKQIESATPNQLVMLLYDGAIDFLNRAEAATRETSPKRIETYHNNVIRCQNILSELMVSLDLEKGGDLAENLYRLYEYMHYRLLSSNIHKGSEAITEVKRLLSELKQGWAYAVDKETKLAKPTVSTNSGLNLKG